MLTLIMMSTPKDETHHNVYSHHYSSWIGASCSLSSWIGASCSLSSFLIMDRSLMLPLIMDRSLTYAYKLRASDERNIYMKCVRTSQRKRRARQVK
jgi:hypothetical protein